MSEQQRQDAGWQNAMDYGDEVAYEAGALIVPLGVDRACARLDDNVIFIGDRVRHTSGAIGIVQRIVWWNRVRDGGYFIVDFETADDRYLNDVAENFEVYGAGFPESDMEIPL
jgi:hypothetical protein